MSMSEHKIITCLTAAVMSLTSLPNLFVSADEALFGDVDKDGVITGHDTAIVSRSLYDDTFELTEEQIMLADMDGDGTVTQEDLEVIHAAEVYAVGSFYGGCEGTVKAFGAPVDMRDAHGILLLSSLVSVGCKVELDVNAEFKTSRDMMDLYLSGKIMTITVNPVQYNLADTNADGKIDMNDAMLTLFANSHYMVGDSIYAIEGRYEFLPESYRTSD